jgi:hypothetical protein
LTAGADAVSRALQRYADRGVFRGLSAHSGRGGRLEFRFTWLMHRPMTLLYDPRTAALTFKNMLPCVGSTTSLRKELYGLVDGRRTRVVPAHKRIDARRARLVRSTRNGDFSLTLVVRGRHHEYAVQKGLNLVNDLFVLLHSTYPDYLEEQFGLRAE